MKVYRFPKGHAILNCGKTEDGTFCLVVSESDKERRIGGTYSDYDIGEKVDDLFAIAFEVPEQVDSWARTLRRIAKVMRFGGVQVRQIQGKDWTATDEQKRIADALRCCGDSEHEFDCYYCPLTEDGDECRKLVPLAANLIERMAEEISELKDEASTLRIKNGALNSYVGFVEDKNTKLKRELDIAIEVISKIEEWIVIAEPYKIVQGIIDSWRKPKSL